MVMGDEKTTDFTGSGIKWKCKACNYVYKGKHPEVCIYCKRSKEFEMVVE